MTTNIPDKLHFKIGEVSKIADVAAHVLRYWESEFSDINPKRAGSKQRLYRREDVELILVIKNLLHVQGYTISGARKLISESDNVCDLKIIDEKDSTASQIGSIKQELLELKKLLSRKI
jgi:DNA-binding transcriptional MerR regulator